MPQGFSQHRLASAVFAIGFLLRFLPLVLHHSVAQGDEIFQAAEQGHRLVFGYGARSWILPLLSAGPMAVAKALHAGPELYLPLIAGLFSAVGAASTLAIFLRAESVYGPMGAAGAALASAAWIDNMYFGGRTLSGPLAAHLLVLAVLIGAQANRRSILVCSGFLAGAALVVRMQLAPAIALLWLWPPVSRQRLLFLTAGAILALMADALLDTLTWGTPFLPLWQNFRFNFALHGAAHFSIDPWSAYFRFMAYNWGASAILFLGLALLGARRMPILLVMAVTIIAAHMLIGHKEFRFIFPAIAMLSVLAGFGLVELTRIVANGVGADRAMPAPAWLALLVGASWAAISLLNVTGRGYEPEWRRSGDTLSAQLQLSHMPGICGVGFDTRIAWTGGYTYLHQPVPLYAFNPGLSGDAIKAANVLVAAPSFPLGRSAASLYRRQQCFKDRCIFQRPGGCEPLPHLTLPSGPLTIPVVDFYTNATREFP